MAHLVQLVFYGEILPGFDAATAREKLAALLKLQPNQTDAVFSGQRIVLRKGMSQAEAELYLLHMQHLGVKALIEDIPQAQPVVETPAAPVEPEAPPAPEEIVQPPAAKLLAKLLAEEQASNTKPPAPKESSGPPAKDLLAHVLADDSLALEEMSCPKCGERQPPRTLCRACAVDMKRFVAAQKESEEAARAERIAAREDALNVKRAALAPRGGSRTSRNERAVADGDAASMIGLGFSGRLGRSAYWGGLFFSGAIFGLAWLLTLKTQSWVPVFLCLLLLLIYSIRLMVLRCHDRDWSGWLVLLSLVPLVGVIFGLMLAFMPGTDDNRYGEKPQSAGFLVMIGMFVLSAIVYGVASQPAQQMAGMQMLAERAGKSFGANAPGGMQVTIYVKNNCEPCERMMDLMDKQGVDYIEKNIDLSAEDRNEYEATGASVMPHIVVGGGKNSGGFPSRH